MEIHSSYNGYWFWGRPTNDQPLEVVSPVFLTTLGVVAMVGISTAVVAAPDSAGRGTPWRFFR